MACNINQSDRMNRSAIGLIIFLAALLGASSLFFMVIGIVMIIQGFIGWCSLPYFISLFQKKDNAK